MTDVVWWAVFFGSHRQHFAQRVVWLVGPPISPEDYASQRLWELSEGPDPVIPAMPPGYVRCGIYDNRPDDTLGVLLGFAERLFTVSDLGCSGLTGLAAGRGRVADRGQ